MTVCRSWVPFSRDIDNPKATENSTGIAAKSHWRCLGTEHVKVHTYGCMYVPIYSEPRQTLDSLSIVHQIDGVVDPRSAVLRRLTGTVKLDFMTGLSRRFQGRSIIDLTVGSSLQ